MVQELWGLAARCYRAGNLAAAEIACRNILDVEPADPKALNLLGVIAAQLGLHAQAGEYFEASLRADPTVPGVKRNLEQLSAAPESQTRPSAGEPKYLVIKSWGYGFWSDVSHLLGCLLLSEIMDRIPVTHWGKNSLFGGGSDEDVFGRYFEPVSRVNLNDIMALKGADYFPPKWSKGNLPAEDLQKWDGQFSRAAALYFLNRPERVAVSDFYIGVADVAPWISAGHPMHNKALPDIFRYLIRKYLRPRRSILEECDRFQAEHLQGAPYAAIHIRGSDKVLEDPDLRVANEACLAALTQVDSSWRIFLLTDDQRWLDRVRSAHGGRVVSTECGRTNTDTGVHYLATSQGLRAGTEVMIDTYLAARADRFIGNGRSNVSAMIALLNDWRPEDCILVRPSGLMKRNLFIHLR
jgi:protein O-GlcNAc transferase